MKYTRINVLLLLLFSACSPAEDKKSPSTESSVTGTTVNASEMQQIQKDSVLQLNPKTTPPSTPSPSLHPELTCFQDSSGWGYDIRMNGKLSIHQPFIPAIQGNQSFSTKNEAEKTGALMVYKIQNHKMPPAVTCKELDSLGIRYKR